MHDVHLPAGLVLLTKNRVRVAALGVRGWSETRRVLAVRPAKRTREGKEGSGERDGAGAGYNKLRAWVDDTLIFVCLHVRRRYAIA